jgi:SAM-dependent methyltransferase
MLDIDREVYRRTIEREQSSFGTDSVMDCRVCGTRTLLLVDRGDVALYRCAACDFVSGYPSVPLEPEQRYERYYDKPAPPAPDVRYHEWLTQAEAAVGRGRLLEVGAGSGGFSRAALARGWEVDATEISKSALGELRASGGTVFAGDVAAACYPDRRFDLVVSLEVVEHLPAPLAHLTELCRVTRPEGLLLLTTPNFFGISGRWLGARWRVVSPEHLGYFTLSTLSSTLRRAGYQSVRVTSRSLDVLSWRRGAGPAGAREFDAQTAARLRDTVQAWPVLRFGKMAANGVLRIAGLGDSLLVWARR